MSAKGLSPALKPPPGTRALPASVSSHVKCSQHTHLLVFLRADRSQKGQQLEQNSGQVAQRSWPLTPQKISPLQSRPRLPICAHHSSSIGTRRPGPYILKPAGHLWAGRLLCASVLHLYHAGTDFILMGSNNILFYAPISPCFLELLGLA